MKRISAKPTRTCELSSVVTESLEGRTLMSSIIVNSVADNAIGGDGLVTLREAVNAANNDTVTDTGQAGSGADVITFDLGTADQTINLVGALPNLSSDLQILGPGSDLLSVRRSTASDYRIFNILAGRSVTLSGMTIANGRMMTAGVGGGGILNAGSLTLENCLIRDNRASFGGGVASTGTLVIRGGALVENVAAAGNGGAIYNLGSLSMTNTAMDQNSAPANIGGGLYNNFGTATITRSSITLNDAPIGGGLFNDPDGTVVISESQIAANTAHHGAGAFSSGTLRISTSDVRANLAPDGAGLVNNGILFVTDSSITENRAGTGGGIYNNHVATITGTVISDNLADGNVGAGIFNNGQLDVVESRISGNHASYNGGGIFTMPGKSLTLSRTTISNGSAHSGGGIYSDAGATLTLNDSTLNNNFASFNGGGIFNGGSAFVSNSTICINTASSQGGGIFNSTAAAITVEHSTVSANGARAQGAGIYNLGSTNIGHTIVAANFSDNIVNLGSADTSFFNFIDGDPRLLPLADNGGPTMTMALIGDSPCINAGDPNFIAPPQFDQRGEPFDRVFAGRIDIGAFELRNYAPATTGLADITVIEDAPDSHVSLHDFFNDVEDGPAGLAYSIIENTDWSLVTPVIEDGSGVLTLSYAPDAYGTALITVRATDSAGAWVDSTFTLTVRSVEEQLQSLRQTVQGLASSNQGNINSLLSKLSLNGDSGGAGKVIGFQNEVQALLSGQRISQSEADLLLEAAAKLLVSLG